MRSWYDVMVKGALADNAEAVPASPEKAKVENEEHLEDIREGGRGGIDSHYRSSQCVLCGSSTGEGKYIAWRITCMIIDILVSSCMSALQEQPRRLLACTARPLAGG